MAGHFVRFNDRYRSMKVKSRFEDVGQSARRS